MAAPLELGSSATFRAPRYTPNTDRTPSRTPSIQAQTAQDHRGVPSVDGKAANMATGAAFDSRHNSIGSSIVHERLRRSREVSAMPASMPRW